MNAGATSCGMARHPCSKVKRQASFSHLAVQGLSNSNTPYFRTNLDASSRRLFSVRCIRRGNIRRDRGGRRAPLSYLGRLVRPRSRGHIHPQNISLWLRTSHQRALCTGLSVLRRCCTAARQDADGRISVLEVLPDADNDHCLSDLEVALEATMLPASMRYVACMFWSTVAPAIRYASKAGPRLIVLGLYRRRSISDALP
ncbi:hypothetical protein BD413DRAFT_576135 [Trametes elegans]|nr:hypothetical protein BD413DRAFT_576135 [Trametes elegans]